MLGVEARGRLADSALPVTNRPVLAAKAVLPDTEPQQRAMRRRMLDTA